MNENSQKIYKKDELLTIIGNRILVENRNEVIPITPFSKRANCHVNTVAERWAIIGFCMEILKEVDIQFFKGENDLPNKIIIRDKEKNHLKRISEELKDIKKQLEELSKKSTNEVH